MSDELKDYRVKLRVHVSKVIEVEKAVKADHAGGAVQDVVDQVTYASEWDTWKLLEASVKPV